MGRPSTSTSPRRSAAARAKDSSAPRIVNSNSLQAIAMTYGPLMRVGHVNGNANNNFVVQGSSSTKIVSLHSAAAARGAGNVNFSISASTGDITVEGPFTFADNGG